MSGDAKLMGEMARVARTESIKREVINLPWPNSGVKQKRQYRQRRTAGVSDLRAASRTS